MTHRWIGRVAAVIVTIFTWLLALALWASPVRAGDCKIQSVDGRSVQTCDDGYLETRGAGRTHVYGIRNGGVARYPGHTPPSWALERRR